MPPRHLFAPNPRQRGGITLAVSITLLFVLSLLSLFTARQGLRALHEEDSRLQQARARAAAEAGLDLGLAGLTPAMLDHPLSPGPAGIVTDGSRYHSRILKTGVRRLRVIATGRAPGGASARLHQDALFLPYLVQLPPTALTVRGTVDLPGDWVIADGGGLRIWSGGALRWAGSRTTAADCRKLGLCGDDRRLARMDEHAWRRQFLALPLSGLKRAARRPRPGDHALYYLDEGKTGTVTLAGLRLGTAGAPVLVVIDGALASLDYSHIQGLVYVSGDCLASAGNLVLEGALICGGSLHLTGHYRISHRRDILRRLERLAGRFSPLPGTWRDGGA